MGFSGKQNITKNQTFRREIECNFVSQYKNKITVLHLRISVHCFIFLQLFENNLDNFTIKVFPLGSLVYTRLPEEMIDILRCPQHNQSEEPPVLKF